MKKKALKTVDVVMLSTRYVNVVKVGSLKAEHGDGMRYEL